MPNEAAWKARIVDYWLLFGLVLVSVLLFVPGIGNYPLWDPWEGHYSQVAMEMVWNNAWWEPHYRVSTKSFWSKPIFTFWLMLGSLKSFRIHQVGDFAQAEFYLRLPIALIGAAGVGFMFFFVKRLWNRTAGILVALVLATCPQYFLISRQVMVDIPFLVVQFSAIGFMALGMFDPSPADDDKESSFGVKLSLLFAGFFAALQLGEMLYWKSKLGTNWATTWQQSNVIWSVFVAFFVIWALIRHFVRTPQHRFFLLFFIFSGLASLAKGLLSIALPAGIVGFYILVTWDWDLLKRIRFFYIPKESNYKGSIFLGSLSCLVAVVFIVLPMFAHGGIQRMFPKATGGTKSFLAFFNNQIVLPYMKLSMPQQIGLFAVVLLSIAVIASFFEKKRFEYFYAVFFSGLLVYVLIGNAWVYVMNYKHGSPFMEEWFIYHHFSRMQGVIEKPNNSFDLYIKQIGFGMFPWSALIPIAITKFLVWDGKDMENKARLRNLFFFCGFAFLFFFYQISSTKFHHYIFPVVPFLAIMIGVWMSNLFKEGGAKWGKLGLSFGLLFFAMMAKDLWTNYQPLHQLFTYYTDRTVPPFVYPKEIFIAIFFFIGIFWLSMILVKKIRLFQIGLLFTSVFVFVLFVNVRLIPAVADNFSFKALYTAYVKHCPKKDIPFAEYSNFDERSTSFYLQNKYTYLGTSWNTRNFLSKHKASYLMVQKNQIPQLRDLAKRVGKNIYIVEKAHYDVWLVSTIKPTGKTQNISFKEEPKMVGKNWKRVRVNLDDRLMLIGVWQNKPDGYRRGEHVEMHFVYKVMKPLKRSWKAFIHAEPVKWTRHRLNWDHELAEGLYPPKEWKVGEYIVDRVKHLIPRQFPTHYPRLHVYTGLWIGADRLPVKSAQGAYHDGQNRIRPIVLKLLP